MTKYGFVAGLIVPGTITEVLSYGAPVALDAGCEGFVHRTEMGEQGRPEGAANSYKFTSDFVVEGETKNFRVMDFRSINSDTVFLSLLGVEQPKPVSE